MPSVGKYTIRINPVKRGVKLTNPIDHRIKLGRGLLIFVGVERSQMQKIYGIKKFMNEMSMKSPGCYKMGPYQLSDGVIKL